MPREKKTPKPLSDFHAFHNFLYAMLNYRDKIEDCNSIICGDGLGTKRNTWGGRCKYHRALTLRNGLIKEMKQTLMESGANKQRAARIISRFLWFGLHADAVKVEELFAKQKKCRCIYAR